ncbi:unnamed protein product, partial [Didymodactylos carnosus]
MEGIKVDDPNEQYESGSQ